MVCMPNALALQVLSYTMNGLSAKIEIEGLSERTKYRKQSQEGRKEGKRRKKRSRV